MAQSLYYDRQRVIAPGEAITFGFDSTADLASGETLSSVSTALAETPASSDVTVGTAAVNTATFATDDGVTVAIGKGVQVRITIAVGAADADYEISGLAGTSASDTVAIKGGIKVRG